LAQRKFLYCIERFDHIKANKSKLINKCNYYIMLYFTVFLLARSNARDIPFSNILISKKQYLCNK
jgi:hypothetical protein